MAESDNSTPSYEKVIRQAIEQRLFDLHTSMPGIVESFDKAKNTCSVRPCPKRKYQDGALVELPIILNVPVAYMAAAGWHITGPLKKGDAGWLIFAERSLDVWKSQGGAYDPADSRKFHLTDPIFYPGGRPLSNPIATVDASHLRMQNGTARIELQEGGKFKIEKVGGDEYLNLVSQCLGYLITLTDKLNTDTTNTMLGPMKLNFFADYGTLKTQLTTLKGKLDAIKG